MTQIGGEKYRNALVPTAGGKVGNYGNDGGYRRLQATSYLSVGSHRKGEASLLDQEQIAHNMEQQKRRLGKGVVKIALLDEDGVVDENAVIEHDGLIFKSHKGIITKTDEGYLKHISKQKAEQERYIQKVLDYVLDADDFEAARTLGLTLSQFQSIAKTGGGTPNMPDEAKKYNCLPSYLEYFASTDPIYHASCAKLRAIVAEFLPMLIPDAETHTFNMANKKD